MEKLQLLARRRVKGEIQYNDGNFAEVQTAGIEGIDENILLKVIQLYVEDTDDTPEQFLRRFPVGSWIEITTTTRVMNRGGRNQA